MSTVDLPKIAVVGIGALLPSGSLYDGNLDYHDFFEFLLRKGEAYEPIPEERFNSQYMRGRATGQVLCDQGAFLKGLDTFDFLEFGITAKDARYMPLSTRKLIEASFLSLQDSGIEYRGRNVGCYMSGVSHDFYTLSGHDDVEAKGSFAYAPATIANRVSYHLDLRGPSIPIDTACSSTLHTTHLAVQALRNGECEAAVVGGCQINCRFTEWLIYTQGGILSPDGKCKPFDASANGFGRGEGAVAIVLKPLQSALRDHDHIYATILGTGVNSCGSIAPASAPVASAQRDAMKRAFAQTSRLPEEVDFLELHATGTAQGDPTEANWVGEEFKRDDEILIGSVKGNVGHLEITAFLASLCKVCGIFETGLIPPNVNFSRPNPAIRWSEYCLRVPTEVERLNVRSSNRPPLVAMTSSGIGGANGHAVVEGPPAAGADIPVFWLQGTVAPSLLVAGGLSPRSAVAVGESLLNVWGSENLAGLSKVYGRRARSMTWRSFAVAGSGKAPKFNEPVIVPKYKSPIVFVFSGQGTQHFQMGRDLYRTCAPFRASILELDEVYTAATGSSLIDIGLFTDTVTETKDPLGDPWPIAITLPALTMLQLALVDTLAAVGVTPDVVVGHSAGETAVLSASGSASKAMALEVAIARGRAMTSLEKASGTMAAVSCSPEEARRIIAEVRAELDEGTLTVGCYNTPAAITMSGAESHIDLAVKKANAAGIFARKLRTRIPVHSEMMELCRAEFEKLVQEVFSRYPVSAPVVETYSTKTGGRFTGKLDAQYFWDGTLGPVRFSEAIFALSEAHNSATYVEIGPHPVLTSYIVSMTEKHTLVTCPLRRQRVPEPGAEASELLAALGKLVVAGHNCVNFDVLTGGAKLSGNALQYPFAPKVVPWRIQSAEIARQMQRRNGPLNYPQLQVNAYTHPDLADHIIKGEPIMPAAGFVEMAFEFGAVAVFDVEFHGLLPLSSERPVPVEVKLEGIRWSVASASSVDYSKTWPIQYNRRHASGFLSFEPIDPSSVRTVDLESLRNRMTAVEMKGFYQQMGSFAQFGPMYRRIQTCHVSRGPNGSVEVLTQVRGADDDIPTIADYRFHPAVLDAAIHVMVHPILTGNFDPELYHLPSRISSIRLLRTGPLPSTVYGYATLVKWSPDAITYNATIFDDLGTPICALLGIDVALHGHRVKTIPRRYEVIYRPIDLTLFSDHSGAALSGALNPDVPRYEQPSVDNGNRYMTPSSLPNTGSGSTTGTSIPLSFNGEPLRSLILQYVRGQEMNIQAYLATLDASEQSSVLFIAEEGPDGDASLGFTRALRREYPTWVIRVATFDPSWPPDRRAQASHELIYRAEKELELKVNADGSVIVPRVELAEPPPSRVPFSLDQPWTLEDGQVLRIDLPLPSADHIIVQVDGVTRNSTGLHQFVGRVHGSSLPVVGITPKTISSHMQVHKQTVIDFKYGVTSDSSSYLSVPPLLASTTLALAIGPDALGHPERLKGSVILIHDADGELGPQMCDLCEELGVEASLISGLGTAELAPSYLRKPNVILSGTRERKEATILRSLLASSRVRMLLWNDPEEGVAGITARDPWAMGDALRSSLEYHDNRKAPPVSLVPPSQRIPEGVTTASLAVDLFDPKKSYLLIGGIGSLGLYTALWMYQHGARHLILTSRSGPSTLDRAGDWVSQRVLRHLRELSDLTLQTPAVDATSVKDMAALLRRMPAPLGGCMLMAALLNDRSFSSHTQETFDIVFPPKVDAFKVLERVVDLNSLDFFITYSSISGVFGNAGQTNYAAANSALAGMTRKYKNAFSIVSPAITDSRLVSTTDGSYQSRLRHVIAWGMSARELCDHIGDGIQKLRDGPVWQYVPSFDWRAVQDNMGSSPMYDHLVPDDGGESAPQDGDGKPSLTQIVCGILDMKEEDVSPDVPLTSYGLDSLSAASLSFALRPIVAVSQLQLLADLTVRDLLLRIDDAAATSSPEAPLATSSPSPEANVTGDKIRNMEALVSRLTVDLSPSLVQNLSQRDTLGSIVITGTTGSLGAHVLARLLQDSNFKTIYALIREDNDRTAPKQRQISAFEHHGLDISLLESSRFAAVACALDKPFLGLPRDLYEEIRTSVSHIVLLGWPINLQSPLSSFESPLVGLRRLIDLAKEAQEFGLVSLLYSSSFGIFRNYQGTSPPEETPIDAGVAVGTGYSESKWVAEKLLEIAGDRNVVRPVIVRIGQLSGGVNGAWKESEWLPAMICASATMGCLPQGDGLVSWLPVDVCASMVAEIAQLSSNTVFFHLRHPRPMSWSDTMHNFSLELKVPVIPYQSWLSKLVQTVQSSDPHIAHYLAPAARLLPIWKSIAAQATDRRSLVSESIGIGILLDIENSAQHCAALRNHSLQQLGPDDVGRWVEYWKRVGAMSSA
ncbi:polyketide synthase [Dichomitus squalens]|uniref:Polyketide synthase n=1 Tax=Dichomitus squalens TaxID=114155 RepID=A0A4Q9PMF1_9APHY|nr:polyketide synthase [Dichomitus squalens]